MNIHNIVFLILILLCLQGCGKQNTSDEKLPVLGRKEVLNGDTVYHTIGDYSFLNQDSMLVTPDTFKDKIYIADFFFTSCPTICPVMKTQMLRVYEEFHENDEVAILSHTIDPEYDTVALLHDYAERLGVESDTWHFVTGDKEDIYDIGQSSYMVTAMEDEEEPGGFLHSGAFILVDKEKRIRGIYDGTKEDAVSKLIQDVSLLLAEYDQK